MAFHPLKGSGRNTPASTTLSPALSDRVTSPRRCRLSVRGVAPSGTSSADSCRARAMGRGSAMRKSASACTRWRAARQTPRSRWHAPVRCTKPQQQARGRARAASAAPGPRTCRRASWNLTNLLPLVCIMGAVTHLLPSGLRCASMGTKVLAGKGRPVREEPWVQCGVDTLAACPLSCGPLHAPWGAANACAWLTMGARPGPSPSSPAARAHLPRTSWYSSVPPSSSV